MVVSSSLSASIPFMEFSGKGVAVVAIVVPVTGSVAGVAGIVLDSSGVMGGCGSVTGTSAGDSTGKGVAMSVICRVGCLYHSIRIEASNEKQSKTTKYKCQIKKYSEGWRSKEEGDEGEYGTNYYHHHH